MAQEHNAIKYGVTISRAAAIASGGGYGDIGVSRVSETLQPTMDLWSLPEWAFLRSEYRFTATPLQGATALELSAVGILNPLGSRAIVVVDEYQVLGNAAAAQPVRVAISGSNFVAGSFTGSGKPRPIDTRVPSFAAAAPALSSFAITQHQAAALGSTVVLHLVPVGEDQEKQSLGCVLSPGCFLVVEHQTVNTALQVNFFGRERQLFPGEAAV